MSGIKHSIIFFNFYSDIDNNRAYKLSIILVLYGNPVFEGTATTTRCLR